MNASSKKFSNCDKMKYYRVSKQKLIKWWYTAYVVSYNNILHMTEGRMFLSVNFEGKKEDKISTNYIINWLDFDQSQIDL